MDINDITDKYIKIFDEMTSRKIKDGELHGTIVKFRNVIIQHICDAYTGVSKVVDEKIKKEVKKVKQVKEELETQD